MYPSQLTQGMLHVTEHLIQNNTKKKKMLWQWKKACVTSWRAYMYDSYYTKQSHHILYA